MERKHDKAHRDIDGGTHPYGRLTHRMRETAHQRTVGRVRVVCTACRRRLGELHDAETVDVDPANPWSEATSRTWRCDRCGRSYPVTHTRMRAEYQRALDRGDRLVELPLGKL